MLSTESMTVAFIRLRIGTSIRALTRTDSARHAVCALGYGVPRVHGGKREQEFDVDDNPLFDAKDLITVTFSKPGPLDMRFEQVDGVDGGDGSACAIKLVELGAEVKEQQPDLAPGLFLREVVGHDISGLDLETVLPLISEVQEGAGLSLVFSREESTLGGTVVAAANAMDRVGQIHASLSVTSLVRDAL